MFNFSLEVENAKIVRRGLENLAADMPLVGRLQVYRAAQDIIRIMKKYPPEPAGSVYERTYQFQQSWLLQRTIAGYNISANPVDMFGNPYAGYVVGDETGGGQVSAHAGRWPKFVEVVNTRISRLPSEIELELKARIAVYGL